jgi:hypothetical protein
MARKSPHVRQIELKLKAKQLNAKANEMRAREERRRYTEELRQLQPPKPKGA